MTKPEPTPIPSLRRTRSIARSPLPVLKKRLLVMEGFAPGPDFPQDKSRLYGTPRSSQQSWPVDLAIAGRGVVAARATGRSAAGADGYDLQQSRWPRQRPTWSIAANLAPRRWAVLPAKPPPPASRRPVRASPCRPARAIDQATAIVDSRANRPAARTATCVPRDRGGFTPVTAPRHH